MSLDDLTPPEREIADELEREQTEWAEQNVIGSARPDSLDDFRRVARRTLARRLYEVGASKLDVVSALLSVEVWEEDGCYLMHFKVAKQFEDAVKL